MRPLAGILATALLVQVVALAQPANSRGPAPVPSAAQPAVVGTGDWSYARRGLEALRTQVAKQESEEEPQPGVSMEWALPESNLAASCLVAEVTPMMEPVLLCEYGPTGEEVVAQAILWREDGIWQGQLYPQAPESVAAERRQLFQQLRCPAGCRAKVRQARAVHHPDGLELMVVANLGSAATPMEEVHLLRLSHDTWNIVWTPAPGDWNWGHARVTLMQTGLNGFSLRSSSWTRKDRFSGYLAEPPEGEHRWFEERWVRTGVGYILKDQVEEPGAYGTLVRLVYYLSNHYEQRAQELLDPAVDLAEAQTALAQRPPRQGWKVERSGESTFQLDRNDDGRADLEAAFSQAESRWVLSRLRSTALPPSPDGQAQHEADGEREEAGGHE
ncbi:MAG: hypothetical protein ACOY94_21625 [Bacillota bacterium]